MSRRAIVGLGLVVLIVGSACGLSTAGSTPPEQGEQGSTAETAEESMLPVSINEGLASLDSYRMTYTTDMFDSTSQERTITTVAVAHDAAADADYTRTESRVTGEGGELVSESVQEQVVIGNQSCTLSEGEAEMSSISDMAQVLIDLMSQVVVIQPLIENPVLVGQDVVSGVPVRSYTFEVRSVSGATGVEASRSDGSYAIAVDGDYLVRYRLDLELRAGAEGDPAAEYSVLLIELSMDEINLPVQIAFPPECLAADDFGG
jgi:hypothetical protein